MSTLLTEFDKAVDELRYRATGRSRSDETTYVTMTDLADKQGYQVVISLLENINRDKVTAVLVDAVEKLTTAAINAANANTVETRLVECRTVRPWRIIKKRRLMAKAVDYRQMEADAQRDAQLLFLAWARDCQCDRSHH